MLNLLNLHLFIFICCDNTVYKTLMSCCTRLIEKLIYSIVNSSFIMCGLPGKAQGEIPKESNFLYESFFLLKFD